MVRLILGRAGAGKTARVFEEIAAGVRAGQGGMVLLVPEQYSHEAERELCRAAGDALSLYGEVLSFTGLARKVFSQCGGERRRLDRGGRLLCMTLAAEEVSGKLRVYKGRRDGKLLESLLGAAEQLKTAGVGAEKLLETAAELPGGLGDKLRDMALILEAYNAAQGRSAADPADVMTDLARLIGDSPSVKGKFYVDGFSDFTELEKRVLSELIRAGAELTVCLTCSRDGEDSALSLAADTARWLARRAEEYGAELRREWLEPEEKSSPLAFYGSHLFDFTPDTPPENDGSIRLVTAADMYEECELAAARMAELARQGVRFREMAVAVRGFGDYRPALESVCARYEVPLFLSGKGDILRKSVPLFIASALEAVCRGYEYEAMFSYLKTGLAGISMEECDRLENYVILWSVRGGMWQRPFTMHPEGYNRLFREEHTALMETLNDIRQRVIAPLKGLEAAGKAAQTAREQAQALADFLEEMGLASLLEQRARELENAGRLEAAAEYGQLWSIVCTALEQFAEALGDMSMDMERFQSLFCLMLSKYDVGVIPVSLDRVQAGDIDRMRRRHIRHLLVLGASDGRLPAPEEGGGVFTPEEREELTALGIAMGSAEEDFARELGRIYNCLTLPSETLYISWPLTDADGGETRPSMIAERARGMFAIAPERGDILRARTFSREAAFSLAVQGEAGSPAPACRAAREYYSNTDRAGELSTLVAAAKAGRGNLSPEAVRALYGEKTAMSATRAQRFSDCRFAYFLQYGLKAKPRQRAVFDQRDYGTFMHYILENVGRDAVALGGFPKLSERKLRELTDFYVDKYIREELDDFAQKSARFEYLFRRLRSTVHKVTEDMRQELMGSKFQPLDLELDLTAPGVLDPGEEGEVSLAGRADRVDGWVKDDVLYIRITDYKTGVKKFSLSDVCEGMDMQMLLYLFALQQRGGGRYNAKEIRPAGILYFPARTETVRTDEDVSDEELAALRRTAARRSGLILSDEEVIEAMEPGEEKRFLPIRIKKTGGYDQKSLGQLASLEQFGALSRYINETLRDMAAELRAGSVAADPWFKNARDNACALCEYAKACMFDEGRDCWRERTSLTPAQAWEKIEGSHE